MKKLLTKFLIGFFILIINTSSATALFFQEGTLGYQYGSLFDFYPYYFFDTGITGEYYITVLIGNSSINYRRVEYVLLPVYNCVVYLQNYKLLTSSTFNGSFVIYSQYPQSKKCSGILVLGNYSHLGERVQLTLFNYYLDLPYYGKYEVTQGNNGTTSHYDHGNWDNTYAIDIALPRYTPVRAPTDGEIVCLYDEFHNGGEECGTLERNGCLGGGRVLVLKDNYGNYLTFLHLNNFAVEIGDQVRRGDVIAYSGRSKGVGNGYPKICEDTAAIHLHFHLWSGINKPDSHTTPFTASTPLRVKIDGETKLLYGAALNDTAIAHRFFESFLDGDRYYYLNWSNASGSHWLSESQIREKVNQCRDVDNHSVTWINAQLNLEETLVDVCGSPCANNCTIERILNLLPSRIR